MKSRMPCRDQLRPTYCIYLDKRHLLWCTELWEKEEMLVCAYHYTYEEGRRWINNVFD